ncbi:MAG: hypothetical protein DI535_04535 [Citrobacter freundii]|nr:MAG: hypothetical protein DI535_04535 [Citrobacter freundii]
MVTPPTDNDALLRAYEDKKIEQNIHRKLSAVITWDTTDVQAQVREGAVLLTGTVADTKSLEQTVLVVFTVKGVKQIENKIKIRREGIASMVSRTAANVESYVDGNDGQYKQE